MYDQHTGDCSISSVEWEGQNGRKRGEGATHSSKFDTVQGVHVFTKMAIQNPWDVDSSKFKTLFRHIFIFILKNNN